MAVKTGSEEQIQGGVETPRVDYRDALNSAAPQQQFETPASNVNTAPTLTFGSKLLSKMTSGLGSEYLNKLQEQLKAIYASEQNLGGYKVNVMSLDREVITNLAYSAVVVSLAKNNKASYFIILLEGTGRKPLEAGAVMAELSNLNKVPYGQQQNRASDIYVTSDAIDDVLHNEVRRQLTNFYPAGTKFYDVDGMVIPYTNTELDVANIRPIASIAFNSCLIEGGKINAEFKDLNIAEAKKSNPAAYLKIDSSMLPVVHRDEAGKAIRSDWTIELNSIDNRNNNISINLQNNRSTISRTRGFVDAMPVEIPRPAAYGMPTSNMLRLRPHVILNNIETEMPTLGYALLALVSSVVMTRPTMWLGALTPKANDQFHDAGKLNIVTNLENAQNGIGDALDLKDPKLNSQEVFALLRQMYSLDAMFSIDIDAYGPQTSYTSIFKWAAAPGTTPAEADSKANAAKEIIQAANWLTNGAFPLNFNPAEIFLSSGVVVPTGRWTDKNGEVRDIKDIDMSFIANVNGSTELLNKWALSNVPHNVSGIDPYVSKVDIISKLVSNAEISGKAFRCTFNPKFISALSAACAQAGLETRYDPEIQYNEQSNIAVLGDYLANAGVSQDASGFARAYASGASYQTPWGIGAQHYRY